MNVLTERAEVIRVEALGPHHWADPRNLGGFIAGIVRYSYLPQPVSIYHQIVTSRLVAVATAIERCALDRQLIDRSVPLNAALDLTQAALELTQAHLQAVRVLVIPTLGTDTEFIKYASAAAALLSHVAVALERLSDAWRPALVERLAIMGGLEVGLQGAGIAMAARPWLWRDSHPGTKLVLAFEAALEVGAWDCAYGLLDEQTT